MITKDPKNILIADDSIFFRTKIGNILKEAGHKVRFAGSGKGTIDEIKENAKGIDLLTLDLEMPDIDGFRVLEWINQNGFNNKFPVMVITGIYNPGDLAERIKKLGASECITKDFAPQQLILRVNSLLFKEKASQGINPRERIPIAIPVYFSIDEIVQTGFMLNLSRTGIFLNTKYGLTKGMAVRLRFSLPRIEREFNPEGIVQWTTDNNDALFCGGGIMFTSISPEEQGILSAFIASEVISKDADKINNIKSAYSPC